MYLRPILFISFAVFLSSTTGFTAEKSIDDTFVKERAREVPAIAYQDKDGKPYRLADLKGKVIVAHFWATWCPSCVKEMQSLDKLAGNVEGTCIAVVPMSTDFKGIEVVEAFYQRQKLRNLGLYIDKGSKLAHSMQVRAMPTTLVIGADGKMAGRIEGAVDWSDPKVKTLLRTIYKETIGVRKS